jgi:hypothetical protein
MLYKMHLICLVIVILFNMICYISIFVKFKWGYQMLIFAIEGFIFDLLFVFLYIYERRNSEIFI